MQVASQRSPDLIQRGKARNLTLTIEASTGTPTITVAGSSFTLYNASNEAVISAAAITASTNTATYALAASTLDGEDYGPGWREEWALVISGETTRFVRPAALVYRELFATLAPADLSALHSDLPQLGTWTIDGEQTTWLTYAWTKLDAAWSRLLRLLWLDDRLPARIQSLSLDDLHEALTLELIYRDLRAQQGDRFDLTLADWTKRLEALKASAILFYDSDDDGEPDLRLNGIGTTPVTLGGGWPGWR